MILTPGTVFYYSGLLLLVFGNGLGVFLGLLMILCSFWIWQKEDQDRFDDWLEDLNGDEPGEDEEWVNLRK